jgi:NADPH:quinone reductase-like Zn-dependent oxidoreductase
VSNNVFAASVGLYTIQLAKAHSIPVAVVCPDTHFKLCTTMGASHVFDYREEKVEEKIKATIPDIAYIFDTVGKKETTVQASRAARDEGARLTTTRPGKPGAEEAESRVTVSDILVFTAFLKDHHYGELYYPVSPQRLIGLCAFSLTTLRLREQTTSWQRNCIGRSPTGC